MGLAKYTSIPIGDCASASFFSLEKGEGTIYLPEAPSSVVQEKEMLFTTALFFYILSPFPTLPPPCPGNVSYMGCYWGISFNSFDAFHLLRGLGFLVIFLFLHCLIAV